MNRQALDTEAGRYGLVIRGGFAVESDDSVPEVSPGLPAQSLVLFGNAGSSIWPTFSEAPPIPEYVGKENRHKKSQPLSYRTKDLDR